MLYHIGKRKEKIEIGDNSFQIARTTGGVLEVWGENTNELAAGMGYAHANDRMMQMFFTRIIGQGRLAECIKATEDTVKTDIFMRQMGFAEDVNNDASNVSGDVLEYMNSYLRGFNAHLVLHGPPLTCKLLDYKPELWKIEDTLLTIKLIGYEGLASVQSSIQKLIIQALQGGTELSILKKVFEPHLDELSDDIVDVIQNIKLNRPTIPANTPFTDILPRMEASNNWAISGKKTKSGLPIFCCDPHMEVNRLPSIFSEIILHTPDNYWKGINIPGIPGIIKGKNKDISYGFTYGYMDMIDYFIEDCKEGFYRKNDQWLAFQERQEIIKRKGKPSLVVNIYENEHGVLENDVTQKTPPNGFLLTKAWSAHKNGASPSLKALFKLLNTDNALTAANILREVPISGNWIIADTRNHIVLQQSGLLPKRKNSGLYPLPGWISSNDWDGFHSGDQLTRITDPDSGILATANNDVNQSGKPLSINLAMAPYRANRIQQLLKAKDILDIEDMKTIQRDVYSLQAALYMKWLRPLIPRTDAGDILATWDLCYDKNSKGAVLFEKFYDQFRTEIFGKRIFGLEAWEKIHKDTGVLTHYYDFYDRVLLSNDLSWLGISDKNELASSILEKILGENGPYNDNRLTKLKKWGNYCTFSMDNMFFQGRFPKFWGFDHGPISLEGNRSTIVQGGTYHNNKRFRAYWPTYRAISDLNDNKIHTVLAGGQSESRLSPYYTSDIKNWINYHYKEL